MLKLNHQPGYRKFVNGRDEALEIILRNSRLRITELTADAFTRILQSINSKYNSILQTGSRHELDRVEQHIQQTLEHLSFLIWMEMTETRKKSFMLAYAGETQAIAQTTGKSAKLNLSRSAIEHVAMGKPLANGLAPTKSFNLQFNKLRRQIISALEYSLAFGETVDQAMGRVFLILPRQTALPKKKVLKTVKLEEAKKPQFSQYKTENDSIEIDLSRSQPTMGFEFDEETWNKVVDDIGSDYAFTDRSPESFFDMKNPYNDLPIRNRLPEEDKIYSWEIENDVVNDFVEQVRSGQVEAAQKNGINDFVWIAILDDRTDECCEWRNGLLSSEIKARLETDKSGDDCREIVPPAHFNCRCTLAPATEDLEAVDNSDSKMEFDEWLNQR